MKQILFALSLVPTLAQAQELTLIRCDYRIAKPEGRIFEMSGNLVAEDAVTNPNSTTYLTLAPNELSGDTTEARILLTGSGYNPITLHVPGQSATTLAATVLRDGAGLLLHRAESGTSYRVECKKR